MSTSADLFNNSELSLAAYATLQKGPTDGADNILALKQNGDGMTDEQAHEFATRYPTVVAVANDPNSDFQATVFQAADGSMALAIRGTTSVPDVLQDVDIILGGTALDQLLYMVNWWQEMTAAEGASINHYSVVTTDEAPANSVLQLPGEWSAGPEEPPLHKYLACDTSVVNTAGALNGTDTLTVTGHSLGGYLAMAFDGLFGSYVDHSYVYNALGFADAASTDMLFAALTNGGHVPFASDASITNIAANEALPGEEPTNFAAGLHSRPGEKIDIAIEDKSFLDEGVLFGIGNHSIVNVTDSLAIYNMLGKLDDTLTVQTFNDIFHLASNDSDTSLESAVNGMQRLLGITATSFTTDNRDELYTAIYAIQGNPQTPNPVFDALVAGNIVVKYSADVSATQAKTDFSAFLSLYDLSPVYLAGASTALQTANASLYSDWAAGKFNDSYLNDRSAALHTMLGRNATDEDDTSPDANETVYYDYTTNKEIFANGGNNTINPSNDLDHAQIHFGTNGIDVIEGGDKNDKFYGGGGNDTYLFNGSFGHDTISDSDGGTINIDGVVFSVTRIDSGTAGGAPTKDGTYLFLNTDGTVQTGKEGWSVIVNGSTALVTVRANNDSPLQTIEIKNFDANDPAKSFGITLNDATAPTALPGGLYEVGNGVIGQYDPPAYIVTGHWDNTNNPPVWIPLPQPYTVNDPPYAVYLPIYRGAENNPDYASQGVTWEQYRTKAMHYRAAEYVQSFGYFEGSNKDDVLEGYTTDKNHLIGYDGDDVIYGDSGDVSDESTGNDDTVDEATTRFMARVAMMLSTPWIPLIKMQKHR